MSQQARKLRRWKRQGYGTDPLCYLCQAVPATTDDHSPPKTLFPLALRQHVYLLPACEPCNKRLTEDEEYLRNLIVSGTNSSLAAELFEKTIDSLEGSSPLYPHSNFELLFKNLRLQDVYTESGVYKGTSYYFDYDRRRTDPVLMKIVQGLYYKNMKQSLPIKSKFYISPYTNELNGLAGIMSRDFFDKIGDAFSYVGSLFADDPTDKYSSTWLLQFYRSQVYVVVVESPSMQERKKKLLEFDPDGGLV